MSILIGPDEPQPYQPQPNQPQPGEPKLPDIDSNPKPYPVTDPPIPGYEPDQPPMPEKFPGPPESTPVLRPDVTF